MGALQNHFLTLSPPCNSADAEGKAVAVTFENHVPGGKGYRDQPGGGKKERGQEQEQEQELDDGDAYKADLGKSLLDCW